jgi:urease accessory protein
MRTTIECSGDGLRRLAGCDLLQARVLAGPGLRVALVQSAASLLAGDDLELSVDVGADCALELVDVAATIAHDVRGGPPARWSARVRLGAGARLVWLGRPFIVCAGARVTRAVRIDLEAGAVALLRDTVVLGRSGERPGPCVSSLEARLEGRPLLVEALDTKRARLAVVAGEAKAIDTVAILGAVPDELPDGVWRLDGPGAMRALPAHSYAEAETANAPLLREWRAWIGRAASPRRYSGSCTLRSPPQSPKVP